MWELILPALGFLIGIVASMTGVGGGVFIVPLLTLAYSFAPANAIGTSLTTITFTAIAATVSYSRQKRINYKIGLILSVTTAPGAVLGAYLTSVISSAILGLIFGVFLIIVAIRMIAEGYFFNGKEKSQNGTKTERDPGKEFFRDKTKLAICLLLSFFGGLASGLLGIGGGVVLVPLMTLVLAMSIHVAVATSMLTIIVTSASGAAQHYSLGNINFEFALLLALGSVFGAQLGAYVSKRLSSTNLRRIFGAILIIVSVQMILKFL